MQQNLTDITKEFVKKTCKGRDESHGFEHMNAVYDNAMKILTRTFTDECIDPSKYDYLYTLTMVSALLHDVNDHKYDKDGTLTKQIEEFLTINFKNDTQLILNIIQRVSYSKEQKCIEANKPLDWLEVLGDDGLLVRNVVSDADKMEALGEIGLKRCIEFASHHYESKHKKPIDVATLKKHVSDHADEKLLRLKDHFIRTKAGKFMAIKYHDEFVAALDDFLKKN